MSTNFLVYPCKQLRLSEADKKRGYIYCPCDEMIVTDICGFGRDGVNTIWMQSSSKVIFADGTTDYFSMLVIHLNSDELSHLHKGQRFKRGDKICLESDEACSLNLFHFAFCKGAVSINNSSKNIDKKTDSHHDIIKPENLFFIDPSFTKISVTPDSSFKLLNHQQYKKSSKPHLNNYEVTASILNVRTGPSTSYDKKNYSELTQGAQNQILKLSGFNANGYVKGLIFTALEIENNWAKTPSGWVALNYCKQI